MAEKLYDIVKEYAGLTGTETVWDFYCGTGSIALYLADRAREVIGFEIINSTIKDACENARLNHLSNVRFIGTNLDKVSLKKPDLLDTLPRPDVLIIDPPRAGMHAKLVDSITKLKPTRIVYVSCNPTTQVRDIRLLAEQAPYRIDNIQPLDLFPHTPHIEVVTKLERIK
jgi:23S rRNA (uracil1939-C5)-methyltransferase